MAKQVITMLTDDLDGGAADDTINFAIDGIVYEIDLSEKNAKTLRDFLDRFVTAGTRVGRVSPTGAVMGGGGRRNGDMRSAHTQAFAASREENQRIRQWAASSGFDLAERGRIPQHIVDAFNRSGGRPIAQQDAIPTLHEALAAPKKTAEPVKKAVAPRKRATAKA